MESDKEKLIPNGELINPLQLSPDWEPTANSVKFVEGIGIHDVTRRSRRLTTEQLAKRCLPGDLIEIECLRGQNQTTSWFVYIGKGNVAYTIDNEVRKDRLENVCRGQRGWYYRMDKGRGGPFTPKRLNVVKTAIAEVKREVQERTWINSEQFVTGCCFPNRFRDDDDKSNTSNGYLDIYCETLSPYTISGISVSRKGDIWCCRTDWTGETTIVIARQREQRIIATGTVRKGGCYFFGIAITTNDDVILVGKYGCFILIADNNGVLRASKFAESILEGCIVRGVTCRAGNVYVKCVEEGRQDTYMAMCQVLTFTENGDFIKALQLRSPLEGHIAVRSDGNLVLTEFSNIKMFGPTGKHVNDYTFNNHIEGLAIDSYDDTIVTTASHVYVLSPEFDQLHSFDLRPYNFTDSPGLAVTPEGNVVVVDKSCSRRTKGCRILVFDIWSVNQPRSLKTDSIVKPAFVYNSIPHTKLTDTMEIQWGELLDFADHTKMADGYANPVQIEIDDEEELNKMTAFDSITDGPLRRTYTVNEAPDDEIKYDWPNFLTPGYCCKAFWVFCCLLCVPIIGVLIFIACHRQVLPPLVRKYGRQNELTKYLVADDD
ncbi:uncharacterized protein [Ptychodera flava]|uniref:uncharacterized protein n=1 Tax=Ptychodera flava TaxID=63121 RepID=UPI003969DDB3